jgi:hypothetical protein
MTYEEIGIKNGLDSTTLARYVAYMQARWADTETQKCQDGYAEEWAVRFKSKAEYFAADAVGTAVLRKIDGTLNG